MKTRSDQRFMTAVVFLINNLRRQHSCEMKLHWVSTHKNIIDNKTTNKATKKTTKWRRKRQHRKKYTKMNINIITKQTLIRYILSNSLCFCVKAKIMKRWKTSWQSHHIESTLRDIESCLRKSILKLHDELTKKQSTLTIQRIIEKIELRQFLYHQKMLDINSSLCGCDEE